MQTPSNNAHIEALEAEARQQVAAPWHVYDARAMTEAALRQHLSLMWDEMHFIPVMYEEQNNLLLNMLCDEEGQLVTKHV